MLLFTILGQNQLSDTTTHHHHKIMPIDNSRTIVEQFYCYLCNVL